MRVARFINPEIIGYEMHAHTVAFLHQLTFLGKEHETKWRNLVG